MSRSDDRKPRGPFVLTACAVVALAWLGPALDDYETRTQQEAQQDAQRQARFDFAAQALCGGENAVALLQDDGSIRCATKCGYISKTIVRIP